MKSATLAAARAEQRARLIKIVQTGRNRLGLDEDTYRDLLAAKSGGKRSAKDLDVFQLEAVVKHMRAAGFVATKPAGAAPREHRKLDSRPEAEKARALWLWLHQLGIVKNPSEAALAQFAKRTCGGVDALQWARRPDKLIEGLKAWSARLLPPVLAQRVAALQAAGRLAPDVTPAAVIARAAPTLNPASFDALRAAFVFLDQLPC